LLLRRAVGTAVRVSNLARLKPTAESAGTFAGSRRRDLILILLAALVSVLWLRGGLLYFWDAIVPFDASSANYYSSFAWQQLFGSGIPAAPYEYGSYFPVMVVFQTAGLPIAAAQQLLFYLLFASSGASMYLLASALDARLRRVSLPVAPLPAALFYMFNFYVALYLLSDFFESWFLYAFLPLEALLLVWGIEAARERRPFWLPLIAFVLTLQLMSAGFWEPPYLVYSLGLLFVVVLLVHLARERPEPGSVRRRMAFWVSLGIAAVLSSLWWLYSYALFTRLSTSSSTQLSRQAYNTVLYKFQQPTPHPYFHFLSLIALYPIQLPSNSNTYSWLSAYFSLPWAVLFLLCALVVLVVCWAPLVLNRGTPRARLPLFVIYGSIAVLVFMGLQGDNAMLRAMFLVANQLFGSRVEVLYATNAQFILFPIVFLTSLAFGMGVVASRRFLADMLTHSSRAGPSLAGPERVRRKVESVSTGHRSPGFSRASSITAVLVVLSLGVLPWYLWTPDAVQLFPSDQANQVIPSVVPTPAQFSQIRAYLTQHDGNDPVIFLPESYNFFSSNDGSSSFADTGPLGLVTGTPVIFPNWGGTPAAFYQEIDSLLYRPNLNPDAFGNLIATLGVHFLVLDTSPTGAGAYLPYNESYLAHFLDSRPDLQLAANFTPYLVYETLVVPQLVAPVAPQCFDPNSTQYSSELNLLPYFQNATPSDSQVATNLSYRNGVLELTYSHFVQPVDPVYWTNPMAIDAPLADYNYLEATIRTTSSNVWFYVYGNALIGSERTPYGTTVFSPKDPTPYPSQSEPYNAIYATSLGLTTLDYSLTDQPLESYTVAVQLPASPEVGSLELGLSLQNATPGVSGSVYISNLTLRTYVSSSDALLYVESPLFDPTNESVVTACTAGDTHPAPAPTVDWSEVNPSRYTVIVRNASGPFDLLLRQSFDPNWVASIHDTGLPSADHTEGDLFANEWHVNQTGNFTITLEYSPQSLYSVLLDVSIASIALLASVGILLLARAELIPRLRRARARSGGL
jgi:hypothetical protein